MRNTINIRFAVILILTLFSLNQTANAQTREAKWLHNINNWGGEKFTNYNKFVSNSEAYLLVGVPLGMGIYDLITKDREHFNKTLTLTASLVGVYALQTSIKYLVKRDRPFVKYPGYIDNKVEEDGYSFPSNHTGGAFALATSLSLEYPKWYIIAPSYLWVSAVGFSRLQLGVHYPSDVIAGAVIGSATSWACFALKNYIIKRQVRKRINNQSLIVINNY